MADQYTLQITERPVADHREMPDHRSAGADALHGDGVVVGDGHTRRRGRARTPVVGSEGTAHVRHRDRIGRTWATAHDAAVAIDHHHGVVECGGELAGECRDTTGDDSPRHRRLATRRPGELRVAIVGDTVEQGARDGGERDGQGHLEHRQAEIGADLDEVVGHGVVAEPGPETDRRDTGLGEAREISRAAVAVVRQPHPRGQQQLPARQPVGGVDKLGGQGAVDRTVEAEAAGARSQVESALIEEPADRRRHRITPSNCADTVTVLRFVHSGRWCVDRLSGTPHHPHGKH